MVQDRFRKLIGPGENNSVSVADVQRVRRQRRQAHTEIEHTNVRAYMRELAGGLKGKPGPNATYLKNIGITLVTFGLAGGLALFYVVYLAWPLYLSWLDYLRYGII